MWIFTRDGFYSAVWDRECQGDEVMIRAQCRDDLCRLVKKLSGYCDESQIDEKRHSEYRFRVKVNKQAWSAYVADSALQVDYSSVKKNILPDMDAIRKDAYYQVWEAIIRWRSRMDEADKAPGADAERSSEDMLSRWNR